MALEEVSFCPVCQGSTFQDLHLSKDFTVTGELFHVKQCIRCGLGITTPRPDSQSAPGYYESPQYISHSNKSSGIFDTIYLIIRHFSLKWKYSLIKSYLTGGPILDYGCGTGHFLREVNKHGITAYGVEPSATARQQIHPDIITADSISTLPQARFKVITLWHVLEHVYPLHETLAMLKERLSDHGTIFIAVPNRESYDAKQYGETWAALDVPRHLWHFTKTSMTTLLQNSGLQVKKIIPMKLDAYYVSLLSDKYSHNGRFTLWGSMKAIAVALRSNMLGAKNKNQSSLIFVVQK